MTLLRGPLLPEDVPEVVAGIASGAVSLTAVRNWAQAFGKRTDAAVLRDVAAAVSERVVQRVARFLETAKRPTKFLVFVYGPGWSVVPREDVLPYFERLANLPSDTGDWALLVGAISRLETAQIVIGKCFMCGATETFALALAKRYVRRRWRFWFNLGPNHHELAVADLRNRGVPDAGYLAQVLGVCAQCEWTCESCREPMPTKWNDGDLLMCAMQRECTRCILTAGRLFTVKPPKPKPEELRRLRTSFRLEGGDSLA